MKIAYLHGYESNPVSDKSKWLHKVCDEAYTPHMDYENNPNVYKEALEHIQKMKPDLIIGSSMGGYCAYNISTVTGIPTLLFNPAFHSRPREIEITLGSERTNHTVVLGKNDKVIEPTKSENYIKTYLIGDFDFKDEDQGHRTPFNTFQKYVLSLMLSLS